MRLVTHKPPSNLPLPTILTHGGYLQRNRRRVIWVWFGSKFEVLGGFRKRPRVVPLESWRRGEGGCSV